MSKQRLRGRKTAANAVRDRPGNAANGSQQSRSNRPSSNGRRTPCYDAERRELRVGDRIIKCFNQESNAVEIIMLAFEEEHWPYRIDDPLPVKDGQDQ